MGEIHALVIDDDTANLTVMREFLLLLGIKATITQDPTSVASNLDKVRDFDLVLLDLEMPEINGYEMLVILRENVGANVPIIACSVHTNEMHHARELGFDGFLGKPLRRSQFADQIQRILNGESVWETN